MSFDTPILLIAFSRSDTVSAVIDSMRAIKPTHVYVACDGPRSHVVGELELCMATREAIEIGIDWPCQIYRLYRDENRGCRFGPVEAINWFFSQVEEGIILEDDVVPSKDFYYFCQELLAKYRTDNRIGSIGGSFLGTSDWSSPADYIFSHFIQAWGWATWRRAWNHFESDMASWPTVKESQLLKTIGGVDFARHLTKCFDRAAGINESIWDYIWMYSSIKQGYLSCHPAKQLVSNIGFDERATHTKSGKSPLVPVQSMSFPLRHADIFLANKSYDEDILYHHLGARRGKILGFIKKVLIRIFR